MMRVLIVADGVIFVGEDATNGAGECTWNEGFDWGLVLLIWPNMLPFPPNSWTKMEEIGTATKKFAMLHTNAIISDHTCSTVAEIFVRIDAS